jgi:hypothetical protein
MMIGTMLFLSMGAISGQASPTGTPDGATLGGDETSVAFVARDYGFSGPDRLPAGLTNIRIVNQGRDLHHIQFLKLLGGKTAADFRAAIAADGSRLPNWVEYAGGPNAHVPGSQAAATVNLTEGDYVLICWIPDKNGVPHAVLGMQKALSVRGAKPTKVSAPQPALSVKQVDYQFILSKPIRPGVHTIEVRNDGTQAHELVVVRLLADASVQDAIASFEPGASGPPKGVLVGGITGIEKGDRVTFTGEFEPGRYGLICFIPDRATGRPHFLHGMASEFTVQ